MNTKNYSTLTKRYKLLLSASHMVYRLVNTTYNVRELALRLVRLICHFIEAESAGVYILDEKMRKVALVAIFDNKINILVDKKKELDLMPEKEKRVTRGYISFEKYFLGIPLVAEDNIGAIVLKRYKKGKPFNNYDKELLSAVGEQAVTAIRNLQLSQGQQNIILGSMDLIQDLIKRYGHSKTAAHLPVYFQLVKAIAEKLEVGKEGIDLLYYASVLRDAGAIDVPYEILSKTSQLTPNEFRIIRNQPARSADLIRPVEFLKPILPIILYRHEKYDGTGYPSGLKRDQIPIGARIMGLVDALEAMTAERSYKSRLSISDAVEEIKRNSGTQFDPVVVGAFVELLKQKKFRKLLSYQ
ncbi:MAG: GAF domain-containing protein [Candidatus Omnitrophica bacterium]|nr:GAF domain-containing protein [Candidatus Omnitrophota bacterium]